MRRDPEVIRVYSRSLLEAVEPTGKLKEYLADAETLRKFYLANPQLQAFLEGPHIREQNKDALVDAVFAEGRILPMLYNLLRVLIDKKRVVNLPNILHEFYELGQEELGNVVGEVYSAVAIDPSRQRALTQALEKVTGLNFSFDFMVDENLLGGVLVRYKDISIDGTLRGRLRGLRASLETMV